MESLWSNALGAGVALLLASQLLTLYQLAIGLAGLLPPRRPPRAEPKPLLVIVPAHNEEAVIADVLQSLRASRYPRELVHVTVLCDHCTDATAERARAAGADVVEREEGMRGKQHALAWYLRRLQAQPAVWRQYDGLVVVDADNLVHPDLLGSLSDHLAAGAAAVQAALDSRNPDGSWVARAYAAAYWQANLQVQRARARLGLAPMLGGTGMAIARWALDRVPFSPRTLVDDLEYTLRLVVAGLPVHYCECPIFDEKPETMRASVRQRTRWMRGQAACIVLLGPPILWRAIWRRDLVAWDQWLSLWNPVAMALSVVFFLCVLPSMGAAALAGWLVFNLGVSLGFLGRAGVPARRWVNALCAMVFGFTWLVPVVWGFLSSHRQGWTHTRHVGAGLRPSDVGGVSS